MYMYIHVYIYMYVYECIYTYMYVYIYICIDAVSFQNTAVWSFVTRSQYFHPVDHDAQLRGSVGHVV